MNDITPGRAAYEAYIAASDDGDPVHSEPGPWNAAAQAAVDAQAGGIITAVKGTAGDTIVIAFNRPVSRQMAYEFRTRWKEYAPGVNIVLVDNVAAIEARTP